LKTVVQTIGTKSRLLVKTATVGVTLLLLQIPAYRFPNLVHESEVSEKETTNEVRCNWSGQQGIAGPALLVPFLLAVNDTGSYSMIERSINLIAFNRKK
jgi:inner membrane protein involved in colicin E2 resistance